MDPISRLAELFQKFPGIGPRQAGRFVQYLLRSSPSLRREVADAIMALSGAVRQCVSCRRFFAAQGTADTCGICANPARDQSILAIVANDTDLVALERSGTYRGMYFVLGGTISLASEQAPHLRLQELHARITPGNVREIILALPANPEGDATAVRVRDDIAAAAPSLRITSLGRGLSTGSELEYADPETLRSALANRK